MFHANAWCIPYAGVMVGANLISPGTPAARHRRARRGRAGDLTGAVPDRLARLRASSRRSRGDISSIRAWVGGSAAPQSLIERFETKTGLDAACLGHDRDDAARHVRPRAYMDPAEDDRYALRAKRARRCPASRSASSTSGHGCPGTARLGELQVRGPWVASGYYDNAEARPS